MTSRWTFNRTYYGDPNTHESSEALGHQHHHVELAEYIDDRGNTKIIPVEEHSNPGPGAGPWTLIDTYYGDPETGTSHEATGRKPFHRRLGRYINQYGKTKFEVLNDDEHDQDWQAEKREYKQSIQEERQKRQDARDTAALATATGDEEALSLSDLNGATLSYEDRDGNRTSIDFEDTRDE